MSMLDAALQFSAAQAVTATAASTNFIDLLNSSGTPLTTSYTPSPSVIWPVNETFFGEDFGIGKGPGTPRLIISTAQVFATLTSLTIQFRGAPENSTAHTSGLRSDLTFAVYGQSDAIPVASLTANTRIWSPDWPLRQVAKALPRFVDLNYVVGGSNATTGTINADITLGDDDAITTLNLYGSNYKVAS